MKGGGEMGRPMILEINVGDTFGDLECIEIVNQTGWRKFLMKCKICGREKCMDSSTIRNKCGIYHKACGKGIKTVDDVFYTRWRVMRERTCNPRYEHYDRYGGRGISSEEFSLFIDFYDAMYDSFCEAAERIGDKHNVSLERIDFNWDYTKENCMWVDVHEQPGNTCKTVDFMVTFPDGHTEQHRNITKFCREHGLDSSSAFSCISGEYTQHKGYKF